MPSLFLQKWSFRICLLCAGSRDKKLIESKHTVYIAFKKYKEVHGLVQGCVYIESWDMVKCKLEVLWSTLLCKRLKDASLDIMMSHCHSFVLEPKIISPAHPTWNDECGFILDNKDHGLLLLNQGTIIKHKYAIFPFLWIKGQDGLSLLFSIYTACLLHMINMINLLSDPDSLTSTDRGVLVN